MISKKKITAWILATLMIVSLVPVSVAAEEACTHAKFSVVSTLKEADCANGIRGIRKLKCDSCDYTKYDQYDAHTMVESLIDATCTEVAKVGEKCSVCGAVGETADVAGSTALGHDMKLDTTNEAYVAATCECWRS